MTVIHYRQGPSQAAVPGAQGGWLAAVGETELLLVALPSGSDVEAASQALWSSLTSARGIQAVLDELTRDGVSATPPFGLLEWDAGLGTAPANVRSIIRGGVSLVVRTVDGQTAADASGVSTWLEHEYSQVLGFDVDVTDPAGTGTAREGSTVRTPALPLVTGMVWANSVTVGAARAADGSDSDIAGAEQPSKPVPASAAVSLRGNRPVSSESVSELTVRETISELTVNPAAAPPTPVAPDAESSYDYLFGETMFRSVSDAAVREGDATDSDGSAAGPDGPAAGSTDNQPDAGDHDGHTVASADIAKLRAKRKARGASATPAAPAPPAPSLSLETASGTRESLAQPILVGRSPSVGKVSSGQVPRLLTVSDPDQDISRSHVQFAVEGGTVVVTDLHSRNGTLITLPGRKPQQLRQGEPTSVIVGTVIDLGGGVTFTVRED